MSFSPWFLVVTILVGLVYIFIDSRFDKKRDSETLKMAEKAVSEKEEMDQMARDVKEIKQLLLSLKKDK